MSEPDGDVYATPEEAALAGWDARYATVDNVTYSQQGAKARVTLLTNEKPHVYPYYVYCGRDKNGGWRETHSSN